MTEPMQISLEELYTIIGELEVVRRKQNQQIQALTRQLEEVTAAPAPFPIGQPMPPVEDWTATEDQ